MIVPPLGLSAFTLAARLALVCGCTFLPACATLHDGERIAANGTRIHMDLRGQRTNGAVILFLHGGPGSGLSSLLGFRAYPGPLLERQHLIVYMHQRGVMKSAPVPAETQTIANHVADVHGVVQYLHQRFPRRRLILLGHSWGGVLALSYAARHPEAPVDGLALVATPVCMARNETASYETALAWAKTNGRRRSQQVLERLGPPPYATLEQMMEHRRVTRRAIPRAEDPGTLTQLLDAGGFDSVDPEWSQTELRIARTMFTELMATDLRSDVPGMRWPLLVFAGELDGTVMPGPMFEDLEKYGGPKRLLKFETGGHQLFMQEPQRFSDEVSHFIAGLAGG